MIEYPLDPFTDFATKVEYTHGFDDETLDDAGPIPWGREAWGSGHEEPCRPAGGAYDGVGEGVAP
jgi:hypothetical protein